MVNENYFLPTLKAGLTYWVQINAPSCWCTVKGFSRTVLLLKLASRIHEITAIKLMWLQAICDRKCHSSALSICKQNTKADISLRPVYQTQGRVFHQIANH